MALSKYHTSTRTPSTASPSSEAEPFMKPTTFIGNKIISVIEKTGHKTFYLAEDLLISYAKPYYDANSGFTSKEAYLIHDVSIEVFTGFAEWLHAIDEGTRAGKWYPLASLCDDWTPTFIVNMFDFATSKEIPQLRNKMFHTLAHYRTGPGEFFLSEDVQSIYAQRPAKDVFAVLLLAVWFMKDLSQSSTSEYLEQFMVDICTVMTDMVEEEKYSDFWSGVWEILQKGWSVSLEKMCQRDVSGRIDLCRIREAMWKREKITQEHWENGEACS